MAEAIPVFLKNLFDLAAGRPDVVVIITLATRSDAFGKETDELTDALDAAAAADAREASRETQSVVARPTSGGSIVTPAADDEIAEILKRRLFSSIDAQAASQAGDAYEVLYQGLTAKGEHLAGGAEAPTRYGEQVLSSYPFHPELIRVLDKRIGTIPDFQGRRRGPDLRVRPRAHAPWLPFCVQCLVASSETGRPSYPAAIALDGTSPDGTTFRSRQDARNRWSAVLDDTSPDRRRLFVLTGR
jgi:hypothetical protein